MTATIGKPYSKYKDYAESYHVAGTRPEDSQWRGKLAETLGYSGSIHQFAYDLASEGKDSYGRQLRKFQKNSRPAICDLTLNAPKSLSVEALAFTNPIAVAAHDRGVESALAFTEQHLLFSQVKRTGQVERFHTNQALIGSFRQRDNREGEPHLHTHNVIFNVGYVQGKWRSLANEQVYLGKLTVGAIYQNDTAYHLHQAGYKTYWDANGQFELAGNPKQLLTQTFAQRTEKLEAYLAAMGLDRNSATPEQLNAANRATRNQKAYDKDADSQLLDWQATAATAGIAPCPQISAQELESFFQTSDYPTSPQEIVMASAERLSEKASSFSYMDLIREGCRISSGRYLSSFITQAIDNSQELVAVPSTTPYPSFTTRTILQREQQILDWAIQGKSRCTAICDSEQAAVVAEKFTLNPDQTKALQHIAASQDVVTLIQGSAGVGKTRALCALKDLMGEQTLIGCAVGGLQAEGLEAESGIASQTIESLIRTPLADFPQNALIVVDEAGVVSNRQMHSLLDRARQANCRLLLVGDTKQLSAVEQGNPFRLLQTKAGLETAFISQNMRQKDEQLLAVVDLCAAQQPQAAFDLLDNSGKITEIPDVDALQTAIAQDYLTRPVEQRRNTLIMATTHKERATLTAAIRDRLIEQGELIGPSLALEVLQKKDLDKHQLLLADHYQVGDQVRFWSNCGSFTKGELYRVTATNPQSGSIELVDANRQTHTLDLAKYRQRQVFSSHRIEIAAGEEMRFTAGIKDTNGKQLQVNGQRFRVEKVDPQAQTMEISTKGKRFTVNPENLLHSDYRWISTVHSLQGATAQYAIFAALEAHGSLLSRESWYVAASRAKLEFAAYCTDKAQLRESIQVSKAQRPALDLIYSSTITPIKEQDFQPMDEQAIEAISSYLEQTALESAITQPLTKLTRQIAQLQTQLSSPTEQVDIQQQQFNFQAFKDLPPYVDFAAIDAALIPPLTRLTQQIAQLQAQLSSPTEQVDIPQQPINEQAFKDLPPYIDFAAINAALIPPLTKLTRQIEQLQTQLSSPTEQVDIPQQQFNFQAFKDLPPYIDFATINAALIPPLTKLTRQIAQLQTQLSSPTEQVDIPQQPTGEQAFKDLPPYIDFAAINAALIPPLTKLTRQIEQLQAQLSSPTEQVDIPQQPMGEQAIEVISSYLEQTALESALTQPLTNLTQLLAQLQAQLSSSTSQLEATLTNLEQAQSSQAIQGLSNYVEHSAIESALVETVSPLFEQFSQYQQQLTEGKIALTSLNQLLDGLTQERARAAIAGYVELEAIDNSKLLPAIEGLIGQLKSSQPHLTTALAQLDSAMDNVLEYVAHSQQQAQAAEPIAEPIAEPSAITARTRASVPSPQLLAAQLQILTDQIFASDAVYQEHGLRIERRQGKIRASINGEPVNLHQPENLATIVNPLQALVNEFELLSLYEEFEQAGKLEQAIANLATEIVQLGGGNYSCAGLSVAATDREIEIQLDQKVVFKSHQGNVTRPDDLLQLSHLQLQLVGTVKTLQQRIVDQLKQEQATIEAEQLKVQSQSALPSTNTPPTKERDHGFTL